MDKFTHLAFLLISLSFYFISVSTQDVCIKKTPCSCEFSNGTGIDLSPSALSSFYHTQSFQEKNNGTEYVLTMYYFHPCSNILLNVTKNSPDDTCGNPLSICRHVTTMNSTKVPNNTASLFQVTETVYNFLGEVNVTEFSADGKSIKYANGPSSTLILLVCAQVDGKLELGSTDDPQNLILSYYSRDACLKQLEEQGISMGSKLVIIFFSLVIFYLVLGVLTKKFLMGATGLEVVPNLAFWSDLPNLVKDGWAFGANGFKLPARGAGPVTSPDPNSYDSI